jgi:uncharacterized protein
MISYREILSVSERTGVAAETVEKDYCLTWLLIGMAESPPARRWTFFGGTSLHKIHFPDYRFSEDLDFTLESALVPAHAAQTLEKVFERVREKANIVYSLDEKGVSARDGRHLFPLTFDGFPESSREKSLRLDVASGNIFPEPSEFHPLLLTYSDMRGPAPSLRSYSKEAVAVEKMGTLFEGVRREPRDLYDLWFLLKWGHLNGRKMDKGFSRKYGIPMKIALKGLPEKLRNPAFSNLWDVRLRHQVPDLPEISAVLKETTTLLRDRY